MHQIMKTFLTRKYLFMYLNFKSILKYGITSVTLYSVYYNAPYRKYSLCKHRYIDERNQNLGQFS